jgi:3-hydroxyacyl-CoA dehydrogenase
MSRAESLRITLIGAGTIGLSWAALHLQHASATHPLELTIHDTRPDLEHYVYDTLPPYLQDTSPAETRPLPGEVSKTSSCGREPINRLVKDGTLKLEPNLSTAVTHANIIQEQGPENLDFKTSLWPQIEPYCPRTCLLWTSTSGIPASVQSSQMQDPSRLLVVHPYNPPHVMPLLEIVPSPITRPDVVTRTVDFWKQLGREPVVIKKEVPGFVANRLAFALLREAIHLVHTGVASASDIDTIVQNSMGPRWAVAGPFKSYHAGGGEGGLEGFFKNIGGTVQDCWDDSGKINVEDGWEEDVFKQTREAYGVVDTKERDILTRRVLDAVRGDAEGAG